MTEQVKYFTPQGEIVTDLDTTQEQEQNSPWPGVVLVITLCSSLVVMCGFISFILHTIKTW